jgi:hypothetical protein
MPQSATAARVPLAAQRPSDGHKQWEPCNAGYERTGGMARVLDAAWRCRAVLYCSHGLCLTSITVAWKRGACIKCSSCHHTLSADSSSWRDRLTAVVICTAASLSWSGSTMERTGCCRRNGRNVDTRQCCGHDVCHHWDAAWHKVISCCCHADSDCIHGPAASAPASTQQMHTLNLHLASTNSTRLQAQ